MTLAYPIQWPDGKPRSKWRDDSRFKMSPASQRDHLYRQLELMGARNVVISTNMELTIRGEPKVSGSNPVDPGVAVYFERKGTPQCIACDHYRKAHDNLHAVGKTIEALRGIERWGGSTLTDQAFSGFEALPPPGKADWRVVLQFGEREFVSREQIASRHKRLARERHPDAGGSDEMMADLNVARDAALEELSR